MTPAERALLLDLASRVNACRDWSDRPHILKLIEAVEAEAEPKDDILARVWNADTKTWDDPPRPSECPTCEGEGHLDDYDTGCRALNCPDCGGTGEEKK